MKIKYIDTGIGYRVDDTIYLNSELTNKPYIHDLVLDHETKHTHNLGLTDLWVDMVDFTPQIMLWAITHPSSWHALNPFKVIDGETRFNIVMMTQYTLLIILTIFMMKYIGEWLRWILGI